MLEFGVTVDKQQGFAVLRSHGYINNLGGEKLANEAYQLMESDGLKHLIFNLEGSRVVNSIGISILIEVIEKILEKDGRLAFTNLTPTVEKTFKIMGLLHYADLFSDEAKAVEDYTKLTASLPGGGS
ncbi:STAS domain-containing protein [bacterium]|nr:STAS domain-containing protein [candidate division CSSED10-310 bacterium]